MEQRNKLWRRRHQWRLFKAKMVLMVTNQSLVLDEDGRVILHPRWMDCAKQSWSYKYKSMRTPCSCAFCKGERYNRRDSWKETQRIINESMF